MIVAYIQANIQAALVAVQADRIANDQAAARAAVPLPVPREYFIAPNYLALQPPSVFVVCDSGDFKKARGANHINATAKINVTAMVEAQSAQLSTRMADRYLAAFSQILDNLGLTSSDNTFRIKIIAQGFKFSTDYTVSTQKGDAAEMWRKGFELNCDVEFYEAL
jgi:hypothetical protein